MNRIFCLFFALLLATLLLGGCDIALKEDETTAPPESTRSPQTTVEPETTTAPETTPEPETTSAPETTDTPTPMTTASITVCPEKPVIYLYPTKPTRVNVTLDYAGVLTSTYPAYPRGGWTVDAQPDGTLTDPLTGREYYCLFWEGEGEDYTIDSGFVVAGQDTEAFLEDALDKLGLTEREANEFIIYWLPRMEGNAYNLISFDIEAYLDAARLTVMPAPDTVLRVFMTWKALDAPIQIAPQRLIAPAREGFTLVEWGGAELN